MEISVSLEVAKMQLEVTLLGTLKKKEVETQ